MKIAIFLTFIIDAQIKLPVSSQLVAGKDYSDGDKIG